MQESGVRERKNAGRGSGWTAHTVVEILALLAKHRPERAARLLRGWYGQAVCGSPFFLIFFFN